MARDWTGNGKSIHTTLGASNHSDFDRASWDYYATEPWTVDALRDQTNFFDGVGVVYEPAAGGGHLAKRLKDLGFNVLTSDIVQRDYPLNAVKDFFDVHGPLPIDAIVTNPPYNKALEFAKHSLELCPKVAMFLKLTFLEGAKRQVFFKSTPPRYVAVFVNRVQCALNGDPKDFRKSSAACYAWFIWERGYQGHPEVLWLTKPDYADKLLPSE